MLQKSVLSKLSSEEEKKLKKMEKEHGIIFEKMLKAQSEYTKYVRKEKVAHLLKQKN